MNRKQNKVIHIQVRFQTTISMEEEIFEQFHNATNQFATLLSSFSQEELNVQPYENSWTAAQVGSHVIKSNQSIIQAMNMESQPADRAPDERVQELKDIFLDFNTKLKAPGFIIPEKGVYKKETVKNDYKNSVDQLNTISRETDLSGTIRHIAFGDITKLELLHFVVYHTRRHSHQLTKISRLVKNK